MTQLNLIGLTVYESIPLNSVPVWNLKRKPLSTYNRVDWMFTTYIRIMQRVRNKMKYLNVCKWLVYVSAILWIAIIISIRGS